MEAMRAYKLRIYSDLKRQMAKDDADRPANAW